jgi:hypothetical protein
MTTQSASEKKETRFERRTSVPILESDNPFQSKQRGKREKQAKNHHSWDEGRERPGRTRGSGQQTDFHRYDSVFEAKATSRKPDNATATGDSAPQVRVNRPARPARPASACRRACPRACPACHLDSRFVTGTVSDGVGRPGSDGGLAWANEEARRPSPARAAWSTHPNDRPLKSHRRQRAAYGVCGVANSISGPSSAAASQQPSG